MMKFITGIVAFTLTFVFSIALVGFPKSDILPFETQFSSPTARNIASLLHRDVRNGDERFDKIDFSAEREDYFDTYSEAVSEYVDKSESMNDADLPEDFQTAWREHMKAWRDYSNFLNKCGTKKLDEADFRELDKTYNSEISVTWQEVLQISREHGAMIPY